MTIGVMTKAHRGANRRRTGAFQLLICGLALFAETAVAGPSDAPEVWFNMTNYKAQPGVDGAQGWNVMFGNPNAPLPDFMDHVQVLAAAGVWQTPDEILSKAFAKLKQKHVKFAMESLAQSWLHQPVCGQGVESYYDPPGARKTAEKIKAAGGELVYIAMDEPLWYGHYYDGRNACHSSIQNVAERAAAIMLEYKKVFPNVVIGDIEPFPALASQPNWKETYREWMAAFAAAMGQPLGFLHIDINWSKPDWPDKLKETVKFARAEHLHFGVIYNGNVHADPVSSNEKWLNSAIRNFQQIESDMGIVPDQVIFHSWEKFPPHLITDEHDLGQDHLVRQYIKSRPHR